MLERNLYNKEEDEPPSLIMNQTFTIQTDIHEKYGIIVSDSTREFIKKFYPDHVYQVLGSGWCGPAVISRIFRKAGVEIEQEQIANTRLSDGNPLYNENWGSSHERIDEFLHMHFSDAGTKANSSIDEVTQLLSEGKEVIANVRAMDDSGEDGHYVSITKIHHQVEIYDPTNAIRRDGLHGVYTLNFEQFINEWWDYATPEDEKAEIPTLRWIAYADPLSFKYSASFQPIATL